SSSVLANPPPSSCVPRGPVRQGASAKAAMAEPLPPEKQVRFLPQSPVGSIHSQMFGSQSPFPVQQNPFGPGGQPMMASFAGGEPFAFGAAGAPGHSIPAGPLGRLVQFPSSATGGPTAPDQ
ncbi:unnamed protein product, partial [Prorocentrum cordatum]